MTNHIASRLLSILLVSCLIPATVRGQTKSLAEAQDARPWQRVMTKLADATRIFSDPQANSKADEQFPGLRAAAIAWAVDFDARTSTTRPAGAPAAAAAASGHQLLGIFTDGDQLGLVRYLNFWNRADSLPRTPQHHYAPNSFEEIDLTIPKNAAYVTYTVGNDVLLYRYNFFGKPLKWDNTSRAKLSSAARLGAALALVYDVMAATRAGNDIASFVATPDVRWNQGKVAKWMLVEQVWKGKGMGLYPLQVAFDDPQKSKMQIGAWVLRDDNTQGAVNLYLSTTKSVDQYLGWRIDQIVAVKQPFTEDPR